MCSAESEVIRRNPRISKNEASQEPKKNGMHNLASGGEVYWYSRHILFYLASNANDKRRQRQAAVGREQAVAC